MLVLSILLIRVLIVPLVKHDLDPTTKGVFEAFDYFIWGIFLFEYFIKLVLAPRRLHYIGHHIPDLVVVAVPMLRPLRIVRSARALRLLRLSRLSAIAGGSTEKARRSLHSRAMNYVLVVMGSLILICSLIVMDLERDVKASNIKSFGDALWWSITTVTTVGYGDRFPVTAGARAVAAVLMIGGIALLGVVTASIAAFFVEQNRDRGKSTATEVEISQRLEVIEALLSQLTVRLPAQAAATPSQQISVSDRGL